MPESRRSYTTRELAERAGVSVQTIQRWVDAGHLKAWKTVGGHRKIDADSADEWLRMQLGEEPSAETEATQPQVLLVDDDASFLDLLADLVAEGCPEATVSRAPNGFEALQRVALSTPDLLVTDVVMPHMDGFEMLRHLTAQEKKPRTVVVTSALDRSEAERYGSLTPDLVFLPKPVDQDAFVVLVRRSCAPSLKS